MSKSYCVYVHPFLRRRYRARPRFFLLLLCLMLAGFGASCALSHLRGLRIDERLRALSAEKQALSARVEELKQQLDYVKTNAYVERIAREELNLLYPDEIRYVAN